MNDIELLSRLLIIQVSHLARLLASQMTAVGIGIGARAKNIQPPSKVNLRMCITYNLVFY